MSDLKYRSIADLRSLVGWCVQKRAGHQEAWQAKELAIARLQQEVAEHRRLYHNIGQKEAAARLHLARKELETKQ